MSRFGARSLFLLAVLALLAFAPAPAAAAAPPPPAAFELSKAVAQLWETLTRVWAETGCTLDPDGCSQAQEPPPVEVDHLDTGCTLDPNGCAR
jgi:ABC-type sugar transport system substrate-binding protein